MSNPLTSEEKQRILVDLDRAESCVLSLFQAASRTVQELEKVPDCDYDRIKELTKTYVLSLQETQRILISHSRLLNESSENVSVDSKYSYYNAKIDEITGALKEVGSH